MTPTRRTLVTQPHVYGGNQLAPAVAAETCSPRFDDGADEMYDVFIVVSEGSDGEHVAHTVYAASEDDARQAYRENYPDEPIVGVHQ
jgi:hypothetical protein